MKKGLLVVIVVLSLVSMLFSTAAVPRSLTLDSFAYQPHKGYVAIFKTQGHWRPSELWAFVYTGHHQQLGMDCNSRGDGKVSCTVFGGIAQYAHRQVKLVVYGYAFPVTVPPRTK
jgi:hypothetical protein